MKRNRFASVWDAIEDSAVEAASLRLRAEIANELIEHLRRRRLTQAKAAELLGVTQPRVSDLTRGRLDRFSLDTLVNLAELAGLRASITLRRAA
jgi:predicted XRE-type DNA-binding protein